MYWKDTYVIKRFIEYEYKWQGNYGAKGEKRNPKIKATPEQIQKQNQKNRENKVRREIMANFDEDDLWICLKYPQGCRKPLGQVKNDIKNFFERMRRVYRKRGTPLKFYKRLEIGKQGGIHIHILINRSKGEPDTDIVVKRAWTSGTISFESIYEFGGYERLANYIVKQPDEEVEKQLSIFTVDERKEFVSYSSSRNLIRPQPERKEYRKWTVKKLIENGPTPTEGYIIDKNSIYAGTNKYTGMSYLHYREYRADIREPYEKEVPD